MPDWKLIEDHLSRAWGAYQRASHSGSVEQTMPLLIDLLRACREAEREAEVLIVELEDEPARRAEAPTRVETRTKVEAAGLPTLVVAGRARG